MKQAANDYSRDDVEKYVAAEHGLTLDKLFFLGFPPFDYRDDQHSYWRFASVIGWLEVFHEALVRLEMAGEPSGLEDVRAAISFVNELRQQGKGFV